MLLLVFENIFWHGVFILEAPVLVKWFLAMCGQLSQIVFLPGCPWMVIGVPLWRICGEVVSSDYLGDD